MKTPVEPTAKQRAITHAESASRKKGVTSFTTSAVQRAMDAKAAAWGAPAGYYTVEDRGGVLSPTEQVWRVRVRLFGGSVHHIEDVVFEKEAGSRSGNVRYRTSYQRYINQGGRVIKLFKLDHRYPTSSLNAAIHWDAEGKA